MVIEVTHDFYLFYQTLFAVLFAVCSLFWEGFDRILAFVFYFLHQVNGGEVALPDFLDGLEGFMESFLVQV